MALPPVAGGRLALVTRMTRTPYGSWPTPITSELVVAASVGLGGVAVDGESLWWAESRPSEGGRTVLVRDGVDVLPALYDARTAVHEYGGGAWWVAGGVAWFTNWADQRLYRLVPGSEPQPVTPEPAVPRGERWADGVVHPGGQKMVCVRERHRRGGGSAEVVNEIVAMPLTGGDVEVLVSGPDFVSSPRWSRDGAHLAWCEWDHPNMPWDDSRLMVDGDLIAGGPGESVSEPQWAPEGSLWFLSDRTNWWNLYRWTSDGGVTSVVLLDAEIGVPQWVFGRSRYALLDSGRVALAYDRDGFDRLALWDGGLRDLDVPASVIPAVVSRGDEVFFVGASPTAEPELHRVRLVGSEVESRDVVRPARDLGLDPAWISVPGPVDFPSDGRTSHALYYPPTSATHAGPDGQLPPLLVKIHGGPTGAALPWLDLGIQYWTSRGFAVVDVNYAGSSGYGRAYRELLKGQWGIADVEDCQAAAEYLVQAGRVDPARLCIRGGSAGGFTTLAALAFSDSFAAGANMFGVADLEALALQTHKFESRYLDGLVGPYPERRDLYMERSPIHHLEGFDKPLITLQGRQDEVVPPAQSEMIVDALRARGVPVAYVSFEGEQHGFRRAANIRTALDSELSFYAQVLGFALPPSEDLPTVPIENL